MSNQEAMDLATASDAIASANCATEETVLRPLDVEATKFNQDFEEYVRLYNLVANSSLEKYDVTVVSPDNDNIQFGGGLPIGKFILGGLIVAGAIGTLVLVKVFHKKNVNKNATRGGVADYHHKVESASILETSTATRLAG